uniref:T9SS type A sorting domain-containing protein n=1 Tax=Gelidibacter sp. TaxID=2018083 RepID=UPI00404A6C8E
MKNFTKQFIINAIAVFIGCVSYAQNINFTFANAQITTDGTNNYYEADVLISSTTPFKLGSGQLYFTYNTSAFGPNVKTNNAFVVTQPNEEGYICGQEIDAAPIPLYGSFVVNDNTTSRVSWAFSQTFSASTFSNNVTSTPTKLIHIQFKYIDVNANPMVEFEDGEVYDDQFFTACGSAGGPFDTADCTNFPGVQLLNDTYDSSMATLSNSDITLENNFKIYPNPTSNIINISSSTPIKAIEMYNILGKQVLKVANNHQIDVSSLNSGVYFIKIYSDKGEITKKIIKE